ncbi:hypothetical protein [Leptolyngbya sp. FACHB-261]|uniref:hypothetical protein n=1 Tax=Leptolyngbya sp. FACHB-261 TaxID=2692806 RepID=UPI001682F250|nr:hypothetical protein [Leptolyngbya sp. FACHB-261]MBD2101839.1 hypothetical protein [Leptolyngbya sp. FACHB-261]
MVLSEIYKAIATLNILVFSILFVMVPSLAGEFIGEDRFMENLSATLFFTGFLAGAIMIARSRKIRHRFYFAIPVISLIGLLDELSFGERLFKLHIPKIYGFKIDSFHGLLDSVDHLLHHSIRHSNYLLFFSLVIILCALGVGLVRLIKRYYPSVRSGMALQALQDYPPLKFLATALAFVFIATLIDFGLLGPHDFPPLMFVEELFEMNAALSLQFACLALKDY